MGKSRAMTALLALLVLSLMMLLLLYSLSYIPLFTISSIKVYGAEEISDALSDEIASLHGKNRFSVDLGKTEKSIEAYSQIKSAAVNWVFPDEIDVYITETGQRSLLYDGTSSYLVEDGVITKVSEKEEAFL
ncbi:MAG: cell division protein FtsQ/DivIB, partial [Bullifex sp.]